MEPGVNSKDNKKENLPAVIQYYAYDRRTNEVYQFRRMNKYILIQSIPFGILSKISIEEFDEYFEGTPEPIHPLLVRIK